MNLEVGYLPKYYYDTQPDAGGYFPFAIEGDTPHVFDIGSLDESICDEKLISLWMKNINAFPIYFCAELPSYWKEDMEHACEEFHIQYHYLTKKQHGSVMVTEIQNEKQFREIFPTYFGIGSENELVVWSTKKDVFRVEKRKWKGNCKGMMMETVVAKVEADASIFWIGYDGDNIAVISNQTHFSTYEKIIKDFPEFVVPKLCEYE